MSTEAVNGLLQEYSRNSYVESTVVVSKIGESIICSFPKKVELNSYAPLVAVTFEGANELANSTGQNFRQLNVELGNGGQIVVKSLRKKFLLAVQVKKYDDKVRNEIDHLGEKVAKYLL
jgi:predicted regulator of Ras-like GTPase activity (Roadblock/LC7/MglB family)